MSWPVKLALAPLLVWQGRRVRGRALRLPEASGSREGVAIDAFASATGVAHGRPRLRLLVVGDSSAAGVGVATQGQALAQPLARALAGRLGAPVAWQLLAATGHRAADALAALRAAPTLAPADVMVAVLGVNDAVALAGVRPWLAVLDALHACAAERAGVCLTWHSGLPPMGRFPLLPQPLRWVLGQEAARLDRALAHHVAGRADRRLAPLPPAPSGRAPIGWMAEDGYHPGPVGYRHWAESLATLIAADPALPARA
jgi:lysophospholipase L1-like esterase